MLKYEDFINGMTKLEDAFSKRLDSNTLERYYETLRRMDKNSFTAATTRIITQEKFFPRIADFQREMPSTSGFWDKYDLFWELKEGVLSHKLVPKGNGNKKPKSAFEYGRKSEAGVS